MKESYFLRDVIEKDLIGIVKGLPPDKLLELYKSLSGIKVEGSIEIKDKVSKNTEDIKKEYLTHLNSESKAELTIKGYLAEAGKLIKYLSKNKVKIEYLSMGDIDTYLSITRSGNISNNTYAKVVNSIRSFLNFLYSRSYIEKDLSSFIKVPKKINPIKEELSGIDIAKIKNYLEERKENYKNENLRDLIIFNLGIDCGLRRQEFINLNWEDINFKENSIKIKNSKGGKNRVVYFNGNLGKLLYLYRTLNGK